MTCEAPRWRSRNAAVPSHPPASSSSRKHATRSPGPAEQRPRQRGEHHEQRRAEDDPRQDVDRLHVEPRHARERSERPEEHVHVVARVLLGRVEVGEEEGALARLAHPRPVRGRVVEVGRQRAGVHVLGIVVVPLGARRPDRRHLRVGEHAGPDEEDREPLVEPGARSQAHRGLGDLLGGGGRDVPGLVHRRRDQARNSL